MKKVILILAFALIGLNVNAQVRIEGSMPFEYSPAATTVVTLDFAYLPYWTTAEWIMFEIPASNTGTVKLNVLSSTMGANTITYPAATRTLTPPIRVDRFVSIQMSVGADKIIIYR